MPDESNGGKKPRLLDLFCGAGGATRGYQQAGFHVTGMDIKYQPNYCGDDFLRGDVIAWMEDWPWLLMDPFDAIHASPPCQRWLGVPGALGSDEYPDLVAPTRELLKQTGLPYVIENVPGAPLDGFVLCGTTFGLPIVRHRRFEVWPDDPWLWPSSCHQSSFGRGTEHDGTYPFAHGAWRPAWLEHVLPIVWPWMTLEESHDAIPPDYTELIGDRLLTVIEHRRSVARYEAAGAGRGL